MNRKELGEWGEEQAAQYLEEKGYKILEKNYRTRMGEVDLIARDGIFLVFVEVKTRSSQVYGSPQAAVNFYKQQRIRRVADHYFMNHHSNEFSSEVRFDVIAINMEDGGRAVEHLKNAF